MFSFHKIITFEWGVNTHSEWQENSSNITPSPINSLCSSNHFSLWNTWVLEFPVAHFTHIVIFVSKPIQGKRRIPKKPVRMFTNLNHLRLCTLLNVQSPSLPYSRPGRLTPTAQVNLNSLQKISSPKDLTYSYNKHREKIFLKEIPKQ